ncbi:zinc finger SWIM domain-containing protein 7-like [Aedes aegypti]|uniref:SWIM-type domain-containing protein n=1 Tax=Aedes aegypti TaxID=7159 RepID=A0A6I8U0R8_AEDAE|nr:zinc finger SWIM domain-containing protein 7 [Aedes aegypti]XP_021712242.1 zinc finger SWIM domain-containing protein 7-like [Aedes aegypti]
MSGPPENVNGTSLSKEHLLELESLFGRALLGRALTLIHGKKPLKLLRTPSGAGRLYEVPGSKFAVVYKIFPGVNFCTCESFRYWVLQQQHQATCKHVLATRLAQALGLEVEETLSDKIYQELSAELIKERLNSTASRSSNIAGPGEGPSKSLQ